MHEWGDTELFYYYMKRNEQKNWQQGSIMWQ